MSTSPHHDLLRPPPRRWFLRIVTLGTGTLQTYMAVRYFGDTECEKPLWIYWFIMAFFYVLNAIVVYFDQSETNGPVRCLIACAKYLTTINWVVAPILGAVWVFSRDFSNCNNTLYSWTFAYVIAQLCCLGMAICIGLATIIVRLQES
eukprot:GHVL01020863.1.p1 GENE.GHVL01020863.1~~GHVL01020863.1.p1  ORF type:complete len:156 (+),score=14.09 GHVL01020863.1:26-469(+)